MVPRTIEFHPEARDEFLAAVTYFEERRPGLGATFLTRIEATVQRAADAPATGTPMGNELRRLFVRRFPYYVLYASDAERLRIIAVAHFRRRPGYWRHRR